MAKFSDTSLRNEERLGGFEPHPEDDVFLLERIPGYPGKLPYEPSDTVAIEETPAVEVVEEEVPVVEEVAVDAEGVELDNDFISMLKQDLEKSEEKKLHEVHQIDEQLPIDEADNAQVIDLAAINPDEEKTEEQISDTVVAPDGEIKPAQKKKSPIFILAAAAIVLLSIMGGSGYMYWRSLQPAHVEEKKPVIAEIKKPEPKKAEPAKVDEHHPEITVTEPKPLDDAPIVVKEEPKKEEPKHEEPKIVKEEPKPVVAEVVKPMPEKEKITVVKISPKPVVKAARTEKKILPPTMQMKKSTGEGLYVVQIAATPSQDDAEELIERLRNRNAANVTKSKQNIRGQEFYRVRFGAFKSREEAESAARKIGYAQSWVIQVH